MPSVSVTDQSSTTKPSLHMAYGDSVEPHGTSVGSAADHESRNDALALDHLIHNGYRDVGQDLAILIDRSLNASMPAELGIVHMIHKPWTVVLRKTI